MASPNKVPRTCGNLVEGDVTVYGDMNTYVNAQPSASNASAAEMSPFRCNLPTPTRHYKGRSEILEEILSQFASEYNDPTDCWGRTVAIVGLGGIGKSETACKFATHNRKIFPCAAWIHAETEQSTLDSFLSLAKKLQLVSEDRQRADLELVKRVYHHIDAQYREKVLLVFDNATKLQSNEKDFGIIDYLPTDDLANQRFPFIIITSQTPDWQKDIKTFPLDQLREEESLSYFRSTFRISSSECDQAFKMLHRNLQGYPLAMTLAASNIDFESKKDSFKWLQEQIEQYVESFEKEDSSILTQKINQNWTTKYSKTLSTVWQLLFQRLQTEPNGAQALMLLQAVSFFYVPVNTFDMRRVFTECPFCPGTPDWIKFDRLKESIRLLQKFHVVDGDFGDWNYTEKLEDLESNKEINAEDLSRQFAMEVKSAKAFTCDLRVHRLDQLVVRIQTDSSVILEDILRFCAFWAPVGYVRQLNMSAVEEAFKRTRLSSRALAFVGLLALRGNLEARRIVQTNMTPVQDPAATIWRVFQLDKSIETLNEEAIQVLREFIGLSASAKSLIDKRCFANMALGMFFYKRIFPYARDDGTLAPGIFLQTFTGIEDLACELFSTGCSFIDNCSLPLLCINDLRAHVATGTWLLGNAVIKHLIEAKKAESQIAQIRGEIITHREFLDRGISKWHQYHDEMQEIFVSDDSWQKFESEVKSCGLDQLKLKEVFSAIFDKIWSATGNKNLSDNKRVGGAFLEIDFVIDKLMKNLRSREILIPLMESFIEVLIKTEKAQLSVLQNPTATNNNAAIWICSTWMNLCTQEGCLNSNDLPRLLARVRLLAEMKNIPIDRIRDVVQSFSNWQILEKRRGATYDKFILMYSEPPVEEIRTLVTFCKEIQHEMSLAVKKFGQRT